METKRLKQPNIENIVQLTLHHQEEEEAHPSSTERLRTTAGRLIKTVIGQTQTLQDFDELRSQLRSYKSNNEVPSTSEKSMYTKLLQQLSKDIKTELKKTKGEIRQVDHHHLHNTFPGITNIKYTLLRMQEAR